MKVTLQDLKNFGLYDKLPEALKTLGDRNSFVIYYSLIEEESKLDIHSSEVVVNVNLSLYRTLRDRISNAKRILDIAVFSNTFETRDGIFYQLLRTFNDGDKVKAFYSYAVQQDKIIDVNVSTNAISNIYTSDDFRRAISYFCAGRLQIIMQIYDMVNDSMKERLSKTLYGSSLKKVVNLVLYDGGVMPEIGGNLRFMVIGEKAKLSEEQTKKLEEAKILLRSLVPIDQIYLLTGWALSKKDGKWRTNIADNDAKIIKALLYDYEGRQMYVPKGMIISEVLPFIMNPNRMMGGGYKGRLIDLFSHPTLYEYYPKLAIMPISYWFGDKRTKSQRFYFAKDDRGGFIYMNGSSESGSSISILLHEIQHYIQNQEGFATGGNLFLAQFVASVGSNSVRKIFACINRMERYFREDLFDNQSRLELLDIIQADYAKTATAKQLKSDLVEKLKNESEYKFTYTTINFYLVLYIAEQGDFTSNDIVSYLETKISADVIYELFENITNGYDEAKIFREKLINNEGLREEDINTVLFKGYENLYGEMESRSVQESRFVESEFRNYFYLTKWENTPIQQLTVIDGVEEIIEVENIKAALETKDGEYVLHFKKDSSSIPFLHELGHIVHDCLIELKNGNELKDEFENDLNYNDYDEWFVDKFIAYLKSKFDDYYLQKDLAYFVKRENNAVSKMLDDFFSTKEQSDNEVSSRLKFLHTILSIE
jgi:hypothetical protein